MFIGIDVGLQAPRRRRHRGGAEPAAARAQHGRGHRRAWSPPSARSRPTLVVLEATGTYHCPLLAALLAAERAGQRRQPRPGRRVSPEPPGAAQDRPRRRPALGPLRRAAPRRAARGRPGRAGSGPVARLGAATATTWSPSRPPLRNRLHAARWSGAAAVVAWLEADLAGIAARLREVEARDRRAAGDPPRDRGAHRPGRGRPR